MLTTVKWMKSAGSYSQLFALRRRPPDRIEITSGVYRLGRVFKHDFFAATCLYELETGTSAKALPRIVVKFGREQNFCGLPLAWTGEFLRDREQAIYKALTGVEGVPQWAGTLGRSAYAIEYIEGKPLDHLEKAPAGFFDGLADIFRAIHDRGVAYCDANKRSNILVGPDGKPYLVDYQLAIRRRDDLPWPIRPIWNAVVAYFMQKDYFFLYKHKRRRAPLELKAEEEKLSRQTGLLHRLHAMLIRPYKMIRRAFLRRLYQRGKLASPTAELEDHYQPEKATWRQDKPK